MDSSLLCDALFVPKHHSHKLVTPGTPIYAWGARISPAQPKSRSTTLNNVVVSRNQVVKYWDPQTPLTGSDGDHAAVLASKFHTDLRESIFWSGISNICSYRRDHAFCNSPVREQWLLHVAVLVGRCLSALAAIVIALILQSKKSTALCCSAVYRFCWCAHYSTIPERSIQQSNRQVPMK
jgi:hypothetical protein